MSVCYYCREEEATDLTPVDKGLRAQVCEDCDRIRREILTQEGLEHLIDRVYFEDEGDNYLLLPIDEATASLIGAEGLSFKAF